MADFKIYGRIADIYSPRQGETNGKPWQLQDLVIEEQQNEYTNRVLITLNNYRTNQDECDLIGKSLQDGIMVTASCSVSSREWQRDGKSGYSTNVQVWKVEEGDTRGKRQNNGEPCVVQVGSPQPVSEDSDQLPFN